MTLSPTTTLPTTFSLTNKSITSKPLVFPENLLNRLKESRNVLIVGHLMPDADCIGSMLAIKEILEKRPREQNEDTQNTNTTLYLEDGIPNQFLNHPGIKNIHTSEVPDGDYDLVVFVDCAGKLRAGDSVFLNTKLNGPNTKQVMIDHHKSTNLTNEKKTGNLEGFVPNISSNCEIIVGLCKTLNLKLSKLSFGALQALAKGIERDTGNFKRVTEKTIKIYNEIINLCNKKNPTWPIVDNLCKKLHINLDELPIETLITLNETITRHTEKLQDTRKKTQKILNILTELRKKKEKTPSANVDDVKIYIQNCHSLSDIIHQKLNNLNTKELIKIVTSEERIEKIRDEFTLTYLTQEDLSKLRLTYPEISLADCNICNELRHKLGCGTIFILEKLSGWDIEIFGLNRALDIVKQLSEDSGGHKSAAGALIHDPKRPLKEIIQKVKQAVENVTRRP